MHEDSAPESNLPPAPPRTITVTDPSRAEGFILRKSHVVAVCGAALVAAFFLPWFQVLFTNASGFDLAKQGDIYSLFWAMPIFGSIAFIAGATTHKSYKTAAAVAGIVPFAILSYGFTKMNADLFKVLTPGAWFGLCAGAAILLAAAGKK